MRHLTRHVAAGGHGDRAVGLLEREHVVDAVARHGHGVPLGLERLHEAALLRRGHAAEDRVSARRVADGFLARERAGIYELVSVFDAGALGHLGHGARIVAGDDLHGYALRGKVTERLRRLGADLVGEQYERDRQALGGERFIGELPVVERKEQHAAALRAVVIDLFPIGVKIAAEDDLRRAEKVGLILMERNAAVFLRARERERGDRALIHLAGEEFAHGGHGVVIAAHRRAVVRHDHVDILGDEPVRAERDDIVHDHFVFRHRAGLVHAEGVHPGQRFNAVHVAGQHLAAGQPHHAHGQRNARQQVQSLRDHTDECCHRGVDSLLHGQLQHPMLLPDQHRADWDQRHTDEFYQPVQAAHHLAARDPVTVGLRLSGQAAGVALGPDTGQPRHAAARHQKAAGFQLRAALLGNGPRLARD